MTNSNSENLKLGDHIVAEIADLTGEGTGIFRDPTGKSVFVQGVWPGDSGEFRVISVDKRFSTAEIVKLSRLSPARRETSPCAHSGLKEGQCGGCPWIEIKYEDQIEAKKKIVLGSLGRKNIEVPDSFEIWPSEQEFGYRNRAQFKTDGKAIGFVSRGTKSLAEIDRCIVLNEKTSAVLAALKSKLPKADWTPKPPFSWSQLDIDDKTNVSKLTVNSKRPFRQANDSQNLKMKNWVKTASANWAGDTLELFAGSGNFTESLVANTNHKVFATENFGQALSQLKGKFPHVNARELDMYQPKSLQVLKSWVPKVENMLLDPPRDGFSALGDFVGYYPTLKNIIYISCNVHSFTSDTLGLIQRGFKLNDLKSVDQFPQTPHIEVLASFSRL